MASSGKRLLALAGQLLTLANRNWKWLDNFWNQIWALGSQNWDFGVKNGFFPSCSLTTCPVSCSYIFFTRFGFELAFGVNMKVVGSTLNDSCDKDRKILNKASVIGQLARREPLLAMASSGSTQKLKSRNLDSSLVMLAMASSSARYGELRRATREAGKVARVASNEVHHTPWRGS
ncbi:hypothetical protein MTR_6g452690 [Medicago truncatula]|uniref:Uncharacterized protein n=1 Tax=Medicago truncatula TaxID=3880 RepID=A0A072UKG5_MEDTR|nr:hypothetical protein MTR_6g452690 [Medicago truncatula]